VKLTLGTAQFGFTYGIANPQPQISYAESKAIVNFAYNQGVSMLDTAIAYGESESRLGKIGVQGWKVVSKLPAVPEGQNADNWIYSTVKGSLNRLNLTSLYGLLLHQPSQLLGQDGREIYQGLKRLKLEGLVQKIGISIYQPSDLEDLLSVGEFDLVQSPLNIFDRRLILSGWLDKLADRGVEVHARSVFLQGLLLMSSEERPKSFNRWSEDWKRYHHWIAETGVSQLEACLGYVLGLCQVNQVIVGVNGLSHIRQILKIKINTEANLLPSFDIEDEELLNPLCWLQK
jgi:aryl-alcohol dehydrogenase-like predicted oxidoreductase